MEEVAGASACCHSLWQARGAFASDKKKKNAEPQKHVSVLEKIDISKIVWPEPPNITRIRYQSYFAGEKLPDFNAKAAKTRVPGWIGWPAPKRTKATIP